MSNLVEHAKVELELMGLKPDSKDEMDKLMYNSIIEIVELFTKQRHSGFSASYAIHVITKLLKFEPITALTGKDDEWSDVSEVTGRPLQQNKRCSRVFKEGDGKAYDVEGKIFRTPDGETYTNRESWVEITFPYLPKHEYVEVQS